MFLSCFCRDFVGVILTFWKSRNEATNIIALDSGQKFAVGNRRPVNFHRCLKPCYFLKIHESVFEREKHLKTNKKTTLKPPNV